jgi:hypothetical protein
MQMLWSWGTASTTACGREEARIPAQFPSKNPSSTSQQKSQHNFQQDSQHNFPAKSQHNFIFTAYKKHHGA